MTGVVTFPVTFENITAASVILSFCFVGCYYTWSVLTRRRCTCKLCLGDFRDVKHLDGGGGGDVYLVKSDTQMSTIRQRSHRLSRLRPQTIRSELKRLRNIMFWRNRSRPERTSVLKKIRVRDFTEANEAQREARKMGDLRHINIVALEDDFLHTEEGGLGRRYYVCIVMEYCPRGDLSDVIRSSRPIHPESALIWFMQIIEALNFCHNHEIVHRDIKSSNIFLASDNSIRLGDFGIARVTERAMKTYTYEGTDWYMAPEQLLCKAYGKKVDIWATGCILFELISGVFVSELEGGFLGAQMMNDEKGCLEMLESLVIKGREFIFPIVKRCLNKDQKHRPTSQDLLKSQVLRRFRNRRVEKMYDRRSSREQSSAPIHT